MHRIRIPACILVILILVSGCTSSTPVGNPGTGDDERYLSLLDTFSTPLNQSYNPNQLQPREMIAENRKRAEEARAGIFSFRESMRALSVSPDLISSKTSLTESLNDLEAMSRYILDKGYGEKVYSDMTGEERVRTDEFSLHAQDYAARTSSVYDEPVCRTAGEQYRNISRICSQAR